MHWLLKLIVLSIVTTQISCSANAVNASQICGFVTDSTTGEPLIGASVYCPTYGTGNSTDTNGYFCLPLTDSEYGELRVSFIGYKTRIIKLFSITDDSLLIIKLAPGLSLDEIIVGKNITEHFSSGMLDLPVQLVQKLPNLSGEADIMKTFQLMPGVKMGDEGSSALYVRGGTPDQNLTLLDDVPLYYVNHIGGFLSVYDVNTVKKASLYKADFPARFSGRLSSVLDIRLKDGNTKQAMKQVMVGTLASKYFVEGPVIDDKLAGMFSIRRCNLDLFMRPLSAMSSNGNDITSYTFYDVTSKATFSLNTKNKLNMVFYAGRDKLHFTEKDLSYLSKVNNRWGNFAGALKWNHFSENMVFKSGIYFTKFYRVFKGIEKIESEQSYISEGTFSSKISDITLFSSIIKSFEKLEINAGLSFTKHFFTPSATKKNKKTPDSNQESLFINQIINDETKSFFEAVWSPTQRILFSSGISGTYWNSIKMFIMDPRVMASYNLSNRTLLKVSFSANHQFVHLLSNNSGGIPVDLWIPSSTKVIPEQSHQLSLALFHNTGNVHFSIEGYYKKMNNLIYFKPGYNLFNLVQWQDAVETEGSGVSKGIEFLVKKHTGKNSGWLGYTLSKDNRKFNNLNSGKAFPFKYGRLHDLNAVYSRELCKQVSFSFTWMFASGNYITLANQLFPAIDLTSSIFPVQNYFEDNFVFAHYYGGINNFQTSSYHRLDIGLTFKKQLQNSERTIYFGVYNLYNRKNPYYYYFNNTNDGRKLYYYSLFPVIPSVSVTYKW